MYSQHSGVNYTECLSWNALGTEFGMSVNSDGKNPILTFQTPHLN